jgi:hypothetical protein
MGVVLLLLLPARPVFASTQTCTTNGLETTCEDDQPTSDELHELEQEMLYGFGLVVFVGSALLVGSWRR